jgi:hypothetical protein
MHHSLSPLAFFLLPVAYCLLPSSSCLLPLAYFTPIIPGMGAIHTAKPVKLIVGMLARTVELLSAGAEVLAGEYGSIDLRSEVIEFTFTDYYDKEMHRPLWRQFIAFEHLIDPEQLIAIKRRTNVIEEDFALGAPGRTGSANVPAKTQAQIDAEVDANEIAPLRRIINLDPGYVCESKLVLASTKDFAHRVYLGKGIYAEITLTYTHGAWARHPYTFPDYGSGKYDAFLTGARDILRRQLGRKERKG